MLSDEERKALEQAGSNITRGNDIESAMLILEKCALDGVIFTKGRINVFKIAVRQILNFLEEYKDKGYLDVVREKVKANETIEKQTKEIEELKETLKCTQNSWFEDTQKIEEMKKQLDLDNECEIALNSKIMDLEKEIEELKENNKTLKNLQNDTNRLYIEMIERKNYFERELQKVVDKIKAKIEELDKQEKEVLKGTKGQDRYAIKQEYMHKRSGLQSLLEKE